VLHFNGEDEQTRIQILMGQYRDLPMDLAGASLVTAAETLNQKQIFTLDQDFQIYRFKEN